MRVLVVSQYFWPENFRINAIVESMVNRGIVVEVLTGKPNYPEGAVFSGYRIWGCQHELWNGAEIYRTPLFPRGKNSRFGLVINYISFVLFGAICGSWLVRNRRYDVVFVYGLSPILLAIPALFIGWLKRKKVVVWIQDLWPESLSATGYVRNHSILCAVRQVVRFIYRRAALLLVQSPAFVAPVRMLAADTPIAYYPNSVDDTFAEPVSGEVPHLPGLGEGFSVMFAGNIGAAQAMDVIVDAASILKEQADIHFVVLGDGSCREEMLREVQQRELTNVHLPGRFPVETMPGFMHQASALLVTLADQPIFTLTVPNKVQAYMAAGRPIIACLNGEGARLVSEAGAGLASPAEDAQALADTILRLYRLSPVEREMMGKNGRQYYQEHFNHDHLVDQLIEHLRDVSQSRKGFL
ncbi:MAG: glycosyltransferase family 4 protein [Formivibrio sp.]|nr:glycosyltransferase family 4 protein [Formivibrio sp.]